MSCSAWLSLGRWRSPLHARGSPGSRKLILGIWVWGLSPLVQLPVFFLTVAQGCVNDRDGQCVAMWVCFQLMRSVGGCFGFVVILSHTTLVCLFVSLSQTIPIWSCYCIGHSLHIKFVLVFKEQLMVNSDFMICWHLRMADDSLTSLFLLSILLFVFYIRFDVFINYACKVHYSLKWRI